MRLACLPTKALVASLVRADLMASVTETPESSTETDLDVAVLVELAVKFTVPAVIENVPPRWLERRPARRHLGMEHAHVDAAQAHGNRIDGCVVGRGCGACDGTASDGRSCTRR